MYLGGYMNRAAKKRPWCNIFHGSKVCSVINCCMLFPLHACESHSATHKGCANHTCLEQTRKEASWLGVEQGIWILKGLSLTFTLCSPTTLNRLQDVCGLPCSYSSHLLFLHDLFWMSYTLQLLGCETHFWELHARYAVIWSFETRFSGILLTAHD